MARQRWNSQLCVLLAAAFCAAMATPISALAEDTVNVVAVAPKTLYAGAKGSVSVTVLNKDDQSPAAANVQLSFTAAGGRPQLLFAGATDKHGRVEAGFRTPNAPPGTHTLELSADGLDAPLTAGVQIKKMPVLLVETDKPIYKPGQKIQARALALTAELKPDPGADVQIEITDAKGVKIFRKALTTNAFGVAPFDLALATELNFGTWKITAESGSASTAADLRVEKYVLPRFKVELNTGRDYFLVDEQITGTINADYFFGKPVDGTIELKASRYVGVWEQYAAFTAPLADGSVEFTLPPVRYVSGTPAGGGAGGVQLELTVTDSSNHDEKTTRLLKIVESKIVPQLIPSAKSITPERPFECTLVAEDPDGKPLSGSASINAVYHNYSEGPLDTESISLDNLAGTASFTLTPPAKTGWVEIRASVDALGEQATTDLQLYATYSPSDSFIHIKPTTDAPVHVGDMVVLDVYKTHAATIYYDVFANGRTVFSAAATDEQIAFQATQQMVPSAKIVAYIINPNNEISADSTSFDVALANPADLAVDFSTDRALPGEQLQLSVQADAESMVGLAIVDESVYALNEGRLNMQQVFDELERLYMQPQVEVHQDRWWMPPVYGAYEMFEELGLQVLTSSEMNIPRAKDGWWMWDFAVGGGGGAGGGGGGVPGRNDDEESPDDGLAEVTRVRQFFPETWLWTPDLLTDTTGFASLDLTAPDSITTWKLRALSTSPAGLGMTESELLVFQEFFGEPDLPYAVTRGEQFPMRVQIFNYLEEPQLVRVELTDADWFDLLDDSPVQEVLVQANSVTLASFGIQPTQLGRHTVEVTLRSPARADAVRKELLVEAEGTQREIVANGLIEAGQSLAVDANIPEFSVEGSGKVLLSITPSLVAQSINGTEDLLHMPYGCGEQNMIFFAPDVEILRYLQATGQLVPEIRAKAEHFITTGYQRQLTYRRTDGSFSAFGQSDDSGSLWLTAFVLGTFSGARDVTTIDQAVLDQAADWIVSHQKTDGSWDPIGFVHHKEMLGGSASGYALTAFVTIALADYGQADQAALDAAVQYLETNITSEQENAYALAVASLAFAKLGNTAAAQSAIDHLLELALTDDRGIHWEPLPIETTAYAALALIEMEMAQANAAIKWLSLQQNSKGGFGSTQDTVMALKALMTAARSQTRDIDLTVQAKATDGRLLAQFQVGPDNFDVLQIAELTPADEIELSAEGSGEVRFQMVRRFNVLLNQTPPDSRQMALEVQYDASHVEVDDIVNVAATVRYLGPADSTGMMIVDVGVPTGFAVVGESLDALVEAETVSRVEVAGRKVIFYLDELAAGESRTLEFKVRARFPVRAIIPDSKAYLYYSPDVRAETAGRKIAVGTLSCMVDFHYLADFASHWLDEGPTLDSDYNSSGRVDFHDYRILAEDWNGPCPTQP